MRIWSWRVPKQPLLSAALFPSCFWRLCTCAEWLGKPTHASSKLYIYAVVVSPSSTQRLRFLSELESHPICLSALSYSYAWLQVSTCAHLSQCTSSLPFLGSSVTFFSFQCPFDCGRLHWDYFLRYYSRHRTYSLTFGVSWLSWAL